MSPAGMPVRVSVALLAVASAASVGPTPSPEADLGEPAAFAQSYDELNAPYDGLYHFVRIRYGSSRAGGFGRRRRGREAPWSHDYPRAERNFLRIVEETTLVASQTEGSNVLTLDDPEIFKYPIIYIVEVGYWDPTDEEVQNLGAHLLKGGFLIVDDFRDERRCCPFLDNLRFQLERALPGLSMVQIDEGHEIFDSFFRIVPEDVIPPYGPRVPTWFGIFEDNDPSKRLLAIINYNNDIAEYWEYSDYGYYPIDLSNEAYKLGVNYVVYAHTH